MTERIYLDHNASSPLRPAARDAMVAALGQVGNASSVHREGRAARGIIEDAREQVAALVGAKAAEVVFTSGATEANNLALACGWDRFYLAGIEHESVLVPVRTSGATVEELPTGQDGRIDLGALAEAVLCRPTSGGRELLTLQMANNETGVCQDLAAAAEFCRRHDIAVHSDAVQGAGRLTIDFKALGADLLGISSHKIGGPMGVGALIVRDGFQLPPLVKGGGQERRRRAGTENVAAIAGFGVAAAMAKAELAEEACRLRELRDAAELAISQMLPGVRVAGAKAERLANTLCVALPGELAETAVIKLDLAGVAVSAGSACSSGKVGASHVLTAMGLPQETARSAIRISLGWNTTASSLEEFLTRFRRVFQADQRAVA